MYLKPLAVGFASAAIVVLLIQAEEFSPRDRAVLVVIRAAETFAIEMPFVARDPAVSVVIEREEAALGPIVEFVLAIRRIEVDGVPGAVAAPRAEPDFIARQNAVVVPVVNLEGLIAAAPLVACDYAIVVPVHVLKSDGGSILRERRN